MVKEKHAVAGRPASLDPKEVQIAVRITKEDEAAFLAEASRLSEITGQEWTISGYMRAAARLMLGKHLA